MPAGHGRLSHGVPSPAWRWHQHVNQADRPAEGVRGVGRRFGARPSRGRCRVHPSKFARKPGVKSRFVAVDGEQVGLTPSVNVWQRYADPVWWHIDQRAVLNYQTRQGRQGRKAHLPLQLGVIREAVELWSLPGEVVFSPFAGIGSEGYESLRAGRQFAGAELKESYHRIACHNLDRAARERANGRSLFDEVEPETEPAEVPEPAAEVEAPVAWPDAVYCDGGVIRRNPSPIGGTWAYIWTRTNESVREDRGLMPVSDDWPAISNNHSELQALVEAMEHLPDGWAGVICTDSGVTIARCGAGGTRSSTHPARVARAALAPPRPDARRPNDATRRPSQQGRTRRRRAERRQVGQRVECAL